MRVKGIVALAGAGTLVALAAAPAQAAEPVSQASASAVTAAVLGQPVGTGEFTVTNDGVQTEASGTNRPALSLLEENAAAVSGVLGQDATASADGTSESCAGVVGQGGVVQVGPDGTCLTDSDTRARISLGTLDTLGASGLIQSLVNSGLPVNAVEGLAATEIQVEANALLARCTASSTSAVGGSSLVDAEVFAITAGQKVKIADIDHNSLNLALNDLVGGLAEGASGELGKVVNDLLGGLPINSLPTESLISIKTNEQVREADGQLSVTALHVAAPLGADLLDVKIGNATCGPNAGASDGGDPLPTVDPTDLPEEGDDEGAAGDDGDSGMPTEVPAGLYSVSNETNAGMGLAGYSLAGVSLLGLAGLFTAMLLRQRRLQAERSE